ncbi:MAG: beta-lactamase family protein [Leptospiraceae bacterium]|nr:beta-lactamase family protein [Leptospiraceae bacterium]
MVEIEERNESLKSYTTSLFSKYMEKYKIPGGVITIVKDGEVIVNNSFGYSDMENLYKFDQEYTLFPISHISTLITHIAILQLYKKEILDFYKPANNYLQKLKLGVFEGKPITIHDLLTHTDGLEDSQIETKRNNPVKESEFVRWLEKHKPRNFILPGYIPTINNFSALILGKVIEDLTNQSYDNYVYENIFLPLRMENTASYTFQNTQIQNDYAKEYIYKKEKFIPLPTVYSNQLPYNGLYSTSTDMGRFILFLLDMEEEFSLTEYGEYGIRYFLFNEQYSPTSGFPGTTYGFYTFVENAEKYYCREGRSVGGTSRVLLFPQNQLGIFFYYNRSEPTLASEFTSKFIDYYFPKQEFTFQQGNSPNAHKRLQHFVGLYTHVQYPRNSFEKLFRLFTTIQVQLASNGSLLLQSSHRESNGDLQGKHHFAEIQPLLFRRLDKESYITFKKNDKGQVRYMLSASGNHEVYQKLEWYEFPLVNLFVALFFFIYFGSVFLLLGFGFFIQIYKYHKKYLLRYPLFLKISIALVAFLNTGFITLFFPVVVYSQDFFKTNIPQYEFGLTKSMYCLFSFPLASLLVNSFMIYLLLRHWQNFCLSMVRKIKYGLFVILSYLYLIWLNYWNLLGYNF